MTAPIRNTNTICVCVFVNKKKKKGENVLDVQNVLKNIIKRDIFRLFLRITAKFEFLIYKIDSHAHTTKIC